ncbi:hypothetical protein [Streptomyces sp. NPDC007369]|uniref:hypothetical protein n=1 Tax=Streptomyces sp. NPDC007369 TaxID=3154589 RepID=UPI0033C403CE
MKLDDGAVPIDDLMPIGVFAQRSGLTATDRYRLSTRTLLPAEPPRQTWAGTVNGDELRTAVAEIRRSALVRVEAVPHGIRLRVADREDRHCRLLPEEFPDNRLMLASLDRPPPV